MMWTVTLSRKADKQAVKLPMAVRQALYSLMHDIEQGGPVRGDWPNYGKLADRRHHCHVRKGRPTYVAVWEEREDEIRLVEVTYVGTHEKAPY
jgi:mRNA-degrading endonuclease RelE of RelBE toxin-antitoxin system